MAYRKCKVVQYFHIDLNILDLLQKENTWYGHKLIIYMHNELNIYRHANVPIKKYCFICKLKKRTFCLLKISKLAQGKSILELGISFKKSSQIYFQCTDSNSIKVINNYTRKTRFFNSRNSTFCMI